MLKAGQSGNTSAANDGAIRQTKRSRHNGWAKVIQKNSCSLGGNVAVTARVTSGYAVAVARKVLLSRQSMSM